MTLKDAYKYKKFLEDMKQEGCRKLEDPSFISKRKEVICLSQMDSNLKDIEENYVYDYSYEPKDVILLLFELSREYKELCNEIRNSEEELFRKYGMDVRSTFYINQFTSDICNTLEHMISLESHNRTEHVEFRRIGDFNEEVSDECYEVLVSDESNYDKKFVKDCIFDIYTNCGKLKNRYDAEVRMKCVKYQEPYDIHFTFEDVMNNFLKTNR